MVISVMMIYGYGLCGCSVGLMLGVVFGGVL